MFRQLDFYCSLCLPCQALPIALKRAAAEDVEFRRGLPLNYLGLEFHGNDLAKTQFVNTAMTLMSRLGHFMSLSLGAGVDQMGAQFMHDALPPVFTPGNNIVKGITAHSLNFLNALFLFWNFIAKVSQAQVSNIIHKVPIWVNQVYHTFALLLVRRRYFIIYQTFRSF